MRKCMVCGAAFEGRSHSKYCSTTCQKWVSNKKRKGTYWFIGPMIPIGTERECRFCGVPFATKASNQTCCSKRCRDKHHIRRHDKCITCGELFPVAHSKTILFCSDKCRHDHSEEKTKPKWSPLLVTPCSICNRNMVSRGGNRTCRICTARYNRHERQRLRRGDCETECLCCGVAFSRIPGSRAYHCSDECARVSASLSKSKGRQIRRQRERRGPTTNPKLIFIADMWRCRACGANTPPSLRGTYSGNAPELDHIHPLAMGGDSSPENLQTLCRDCNILKGTMGMGEFLGTYMPREREAWRVRTLTARARVAGQ